MAGREQKLVEESCTGAVRVCGRERRAGAGDEREGREAKRGGARLDDSDTSDDERVCFLPDSPRFS
jgi:hypothetical protein